MTPTLEDVRRLKDALSVWYEKNGEDTIENYNSIQYILENSHTAYEYLERVLLAQAQGGKMVSAEVTKEMSGAAVHRKPTGGLFYHDVFLAMHSAAPDMLAEKEGGV